MRPINFSYYLKTFFPYGIWSGGTAGPVKFATREDAFKQQVIEIKQYFIKKCSLDYDEHKDKMNEHEHKLVQMIVQELKDEFPHLGV